MGISVAGGGIGGLILNPLTQFLLDTYGYPWTYRILGFVSGGVGLIGGAMLRTRGPPPPKKPGLKALVDFSRFKDFTFTRLYALAICSGMGFFVPFGYLVPYAGTIGIDASQASLIMGLTNAFGAIGRIVMGFTSDRLGSMNCWVVMFYVGALSILVVWTTANTYGLVLFFGLLWGFSSGAYVSLYGVNTGWLEFGLGMWIRLTRGILSCYLGWDGPGKLAGDALRGLGVF